MAPKSSMALVTTIVLVHYLHLVASFRVGRRQDALIWRPSHTSRFEKSQAIRGDSSAEEYGYDYPPAYDFGTSASATETTGPQTPILYSAIFNTTATPGVKSTFRDYTPPAAETTTSPDKTTTLLTGQRSPESDDTSWAETATSQTYVLPRPLESKPPLNTSPAASHQVSTSSASSRGSTELTKDPVFPTEQTTSTVGTVTVTVTDFVSESRGTSAAINSTISGLVSHPISSSGSTYTSTFSDSGLSTTTPISWGTGAVSHNYTSTGTGDIPTFTITPPFETLSISFHPHPSNSSTKSQDYSKHVETDSTTLGHPVSSSYPTNTTHIATGSTGHGQPLSTSRPKYPETNNATVRGTGGSWSASGTVKENSITPAQSTLILDETTSAYPVGNTTSMVMPSVIITTEVVTITVYPTPTAITVGSNQTSVITRHSSATSTRTGNAPYTSVNSSSSASSVQGTGVFTTGRVDAWGHISLTPSGGYSSVPCFSGYQNMTSRTYLSSSAVGTVFQSGGRLNQSSQSDVNTSLTSLSVTSSYSRLSTFKTSVSIDRSTSPDSIGGSTASETVPPKVLPGNPNFPWVGVGHPHRLQNFAAVNDREAREQRLVSRWTKLVARLKSIFA